MNTAGYSPALSRLMTFFCNHSVWHIVCQKAILEYMKAVFFDLDGTLFNTLEDIKNAIDYAVRAYDGELVPIEDVRRYVGRGLRRALASAIVEHCPPIEEEGEQELMYQLMISYYKKHPADHTALYPGMSELLLFLKEKGIIIGVISNKADAIVHEILDRLSPVEFDFVQGAISSVPLKPDPASLLSAIQHFSLEKEDVIFVGDSPVDAETAERAGIRSVIVSYGFSTKDELQEKGIRSDAENVSSLRRVLSQSL